MPRLLVKRQPDTPLSINSFSSPDIKASHQTRTNRFICESESDVSPLRPTSCKSSLLASHPIHELSRRSPTAQQQIIDNSTIASPPHKTTETVNEADSVTSKYFAPPARSSEWLSAREPARPASGVKRRANRSLHHAFTDNITHFTDEKVDCSDEHPQLKRARLTSSGTNAAERALSQLAEPPATAVLTANQQHISANNQNQRANIRKGAVIDSDESEPEDVENVLPAAARHQAGKGPDAPGSNQPDKRKLRRLRHRIDDSDEEDEQNVGVADGVGSKMLANAEEVDRDIQGLCDYLSLPLEELLPLGPLLTKAKRAKDSLTAVASASSTPSTAMAPSAGGGDRAAGRAGGAFITPGDLSKTLGILCGKNALKAASTTSGLFLSPHQLVGINWLYMLHKASVNGVLADAMGLGKTVQVSAFLAYLAAVEGLHAPHIIVTPASTASNWVRELHKWAPALRVATFKVGSEKGIVHSSSRTASPAKRGMLDVPYDRDPSTSTNGRSFDVLITTYSVFDRSGSTAAADRAMLHKLAPFSYAILDEGHAIKNSSSLRHKNVSRLATQCLHRLLLSGTPFQNDLAELSALLKFVAGSDSVGHGCDEAISALEAAVVGQTKVESAHAGQRSTALSFLLRICEPFILRRFKEDVLSELPPKTDDWVPLRMTPEQHTHYDRVLTRAKSIALEDSAQCNNIFTMLRKAAQHPLLGQTTRYSNPMTRRTIAQHVQYAGILNSDARTSEERTVRVLAELDKCSDFEMNQLIVQCLPHGSGNASAFAVDVATDDIDWTAPVSPPESSTSSAAGLAFLRRCQLPRRALLSSCKFQYLADHLPTMVRDGHKILLFSQWTSILDLIEQLLHHLALDFSRLDGSTATDIRQDLIDEFSAPDSPYSVFLLSTRSGGLGLNLVAADTVILFDADLNPHVDAQAVDRAHRIGQLRPVTVLRLTTSDTVDAAIRDIAERKVALKTAIDEERTRLAAGENDVSTIQKILQMTLKN